MFVNCLILLIFFQYCYGESAVTFDNTGSTTIGHFEVSEHGRKCLLLDLAATFHVQYTKTDNTTAVASYDLPPTSRVNGGCPDFKGPGSLESFIHLNFTNCESKGHVFQGKFGVEMIFRRDSHFMKYFYLGEITSSHTLTPDMFPDAKYPNETAYPWSMAVRLNTSSGFLIPHSFLCKTKFDLFLNQNTLGFVANLTVHYIQVQPFDVRFGKFSKARECSRDHHTTEAPITTTPHVPAITEIPIIPVGHFILRDQKGEICLLANLGAMFHVEYQLKNGKVRNASYVLPENCTITGSCSQHVANISLSFGGAFNVTAIFTSSGKTYSLDTVSVGYGQTPSYFPGSRNPRISRIQTVKNLNLLQTNIGRSYLCKSQQWFHVGSGIVLEIIEFQIQPFGVVNGHFSVPDECDKDYPVTMYPMENATLVTTPTTTEGNFTSIGPASTIPSNHTTRPVITTPKVPPSSPVYPPVPQGHYVVYNASGHKCLLANMGIRFHINYTKENDMLGTAVFDVPPNAEASGVCGNSHSTLTLTFYDAMFNLTLSFSREHNDDHATMYHGITAHFFFVEVPVIFLDTLTPDKPRKISNTSLNLFQTDTGHSYKCSKDVSVALTKNVSVAFRNVKVQPFDVQSGQFSPAEECADDSEGGSDKVLIIVVGVVLLVIAVGIGVAGVIGRRTLNSKYKRLENIVE